MLDKLNSFAVVFLGIGSSIGSFIAEQPYQREIAYITMILSFLIILRKIILYLLRDIRGWRRGDFLDDIK